MCLVIYIYLYCIITNKNDLTDKDSLYCIDCIGKMSFTSCIIIVIIVFEHMQLPLSDS